MTGNVTDFETGKRLAKVWPPSAEHGLWWIQMEDGGAWALTEVEADYIHAEYGDVAGRIPARSLSELAAKIEEMGFVIWALEERWGKRWPKALGRYFVVLVDNKSLTASTHADTIIDALGAAVAEALEKAGEGGKA